MKYYTISVINPEDLDLIEDVEEREEAEEIFFDAVDDVYQILKSKEGGEIEAFEQIDDYRFNIDVTRHYNINNLIEELGYNISDEYYISWEEYEEC